jgi:CheY-like chemotaxis protein
MSRLESSPEAGSSVDGEPVTFLAGPAGSEPGQDGERKPLVDADPCPRQIDEPKGSRYGLFSGDSERELAPVDPEADTLIPIRLLIVDNSLVFLGTLRRLLETTPGIEVVGSATSGRDALELVDRVHPDAVLTDLAMPELDGLQMARLLAVRSGKPIVVIMSIHNLTSYRQAAQAAGADAFITKSDLVNRIQPLLRHLQGQRESKGPQPS